MTCDAKVEGFAMGVKVVRVVLPLGGVHEKDIRLVCLVLRLNRRGRIWIR